MTDVLAPAPSRWSPRRRGDLVKRHEITPPALPICAQTSSAPREACRRERVWQTHMRNARDRSMIIIVTLDNCSHRDRSRASMAI